MGLTGKINTQFYNWYYTQYKRYKFHKFMCENDEESLDAKIFKNRMKLSFLTKSISEQWGILQDFADHINFEISVDRDTDEDLNPINTFSWVVYDILSNNNFNGGGLTETRDEARVECIKAFNIEVNKILI